ncbi:MAG: glycolate oxidase subunit GlcF [Burkholderiales bacterium]|jgi:glycolate oxidase iron-sulfur subunit|nr:glycolate oxidase subunit GlcF [Burkholderiales bacterium]
MDTHLADWIKDTQEGQEAESILRNCVHCGFCTATCPTYQILGDELDSPRGRIYLIKQVLEGKEVTRKTQIHLDRCLTCRNCESTCPSGVQYGHLIDIGRKIVDERVERPLAERMKRESLMGLMGSKTLFNTAMGLGRAFKPLVPAGLKGKIIDKRPAGELPNREHARKVLMLNGCVQPGMLPSIDTATARVLDALGVQSIVAPKSGCCGAVKFHLDDQSGGLAQMKANIDAWWPLIGSKQVEALVMNASGCGVTVREYGHHLKHDAHYAERAKRVSELCMDVSEFISGFSEEALANLRQRVDAYANRGVGASGGPAKKLAFHPPCTLQHGQKVKGVTESLLLQLGFELTPVCDAHLCCGSAGTYSVLQPELSEELKKRKLENLCEGNPDKIVSSNIGCITHLASGTDKPVLHWIEVLDSALAG